MCNISFYYHVNLIRFQSSVQYLFYSLGIHEVVRLKFQIMACSASTDLLKEATYSKLLLLTTWLFLISYCGKINLGMAEQGS